MFKNLDSEQARRDLTNSAVGKRVVYAIIHNVTGRIYIGSSERVKWRIKEHLNLLRKHKCKNRLMQSDFDTYGEKYSFKKIDSINDLRENWKEYYWILYFRTNDKKYGYNYMDSHIPKKSIEDMKDIRL